MRITEPMIQKAPQVTNAIDERELDLRGTGLSKMDEVVLSKIAEDFDCFNLCDNHFTVLDSFPKMERLSTLMLHKNPQLYTVSAGVPVRCPNIHTFVANGCGFRQLAHLNFLAGWSKTLQRVSFVKAPLYDALAQHLFQSNRGDVAQQQTSPSSSSSSAVVSIPVSLRRLSAEQIVKLYIIAVCSGASSSSSSQTQSPLKLIDFERVLDADRTQARELRADLLLLAQNMAAAGNGSGSSSSVATAVVAPTEQQPRIAEDGTRIRKRGRDTTGAAAAGVTSPVDATSTSGGLTDAAAAIDPLDALTDEELARRDADLMARLENASTEEEFAQIELEAEILEKLKQDFAARQKTKKSRSEIK